MLDLRQFVKCRKPDCLRKVPPSSAYCCPACSTAAAGGYEIEAHSGGCDQRAAERGEYSWAEAVALEQQ